MVFFFEPSFAIIGKNPHSCGSNGKCGTVYHPSNANFDLPPQKCTFYVESEYLELYPEVSSLVKEEKFKSGFEHYMKVGRGEGRSFCKTPPQCKSFHEVEYLQMYPDVAEAVKKGQMSSGWHHYQRFGRNEKRRPCENPD